MSKSLDSQVLRDEITKLYDDGTIKESYREVQIGKTIYRVTSIFNGEFELGEALERLAVMKSNYRDE